MGRGGGGRKEDGGAGRVAEAATPDCLQASTAKLLLMLLLLLLPSRAAGWAWCGAEAGGAGMTDGRQEAVEVFVAAVVGLSS